MIQGESGVGKEGIARAIHERSSRAEAPLVKVNCASIPAELFESEFFGHVKGAFTGAHQDRTGRLQLADGGTLFLDEIGEVPLRLQSKLLRALQEQEFERVGDARTQRVDVRVVAATNRELKEEVSAGRFREDLYYRLNVFPIEVPPLRERKEDIALLAQHFIQTTCEEFRRELPGMSQYQAKRLEHHSWPGIFAS